MPPPADASHIPVPEEATSSVAGTTSLPWSSIPKFIPGTTNVQDPGVYPEDEIHRQHLAN